MEQGRGEEGEVTVSTQVLIVVLLFLFQTNDLTKEDFVTTAAQLIKEEIRTSESVYENPEFFPNLQHLNLEEMQAGL